MRYIDPNINPKKPTWVYNFELTWTEDSSIGPLIKLRKVSYKTSKDVTRGIAAVALRAELEKQYPFRNYVLIR
jgi:hypothetical protein